MIARTGQPEKTVGTVHPGQKTEDKTARTGQQGQDKGLDNRDRQLAQDIWNRTTQTGKPHRSVWTG